MRRAPLFLPHIFSKMLLQILAPREMDWPEAADIDEISCGAMHTLMLTGKGQVHSCGNNDNGQLGHELSRKRPRTFKFSMCPPHSLLFLLRTHIHIFGGLVVVERELL